MGIGISIVVGAVGAVLRYAFTGPVNQQGFDLHTGGVILMFAGALGVLLSVMFWSSFSLFGRSRSTNSRREIVAVNSMPETTVRRRRGGRRVDH